MTTAVVDVCVVMAAAGKCEIICVKLIMELGNIPEAIYWNLYYYIQNSWCKNFFNEK